MFPFPTGVGQVLETYAKIRAGLPMGRAFEAVAAERGVTPSTIRSACTRNLGLTAARFEAFTGREQDFRRLVISRFPLLAMPIDDFLSSLPPPGARSSAGDHGEQLINCATEAIADMLGAWSANPKIPAEIRRQMRMLAETIDPNRP